MGADGPLRRDTELRANRARGSSCPALAPTPLAVHVLGARAAVARGTGHQGEQGSQPGRPQNAGHGPSFDCSRWPHPCMYALASGRDHGASLVTSTPPTRCKNLGFEARTTAQIATSQSDESLSTLSFSKLGVIWNITTHSYLRAQQYVFP